MGERVIGEISRVTREKRLFQLVVTKTHILLVPLIGAYAFTLIIVPFAILGGLLFAHMGTSFLFKAMGIAGRTGIAVFGGLGGVIGGAIAYILMDKTLLAMGSIRISRDSIEKMPKNENIEKIPLKTVKYFNLKNGLLTFACGERLYSITILEKKHKKQGISLINALMKENLVPASGKQLDASFKNMINALTEKKKK